jgi:hypothetical protein
LLKKLPPKKVRLKLSKTKHLICPSRINGIKAILLVDTGASSSCIALSEKERFKLSEKGTAFEAAGAGKDKVKAILSQRCHLILGRHSMGNQSFVLLDMQHINNTLAHENVAPIDGILGADFLRKNKAIIDYGTKTLEL